MFDRRLEEPFEHELTPEQRRRAQARRMLENSGRPVQDPSSVMQWMQKG